MASMRLAPVASATLMHYVVAQPTACATMQHVFPGQCHESHPYLCAGEKELHGGICHHSTDNCCCLNAEGTLSSSCDPFSTHSLCCNGHCLDPGDWECCGKSKCLKSTHSCYDGRCIQHGKPEIEIPVLVVGVLLVICCCMACLCDCQHWLARCVCTFLMAGVFMSVLGLSMWDLTGPVEWRPLIMAGSVVVPLGLVGLCIACCKKEPVCQRCLFQLECW